MHEQMEMARMEAGPPGSGGGQVSWPGLPATSEQASVPHPQKWEFQIELRANV